MLPIYFLVLALSMVLLTLGNPLRTMPWAGQGAAAIWPVGLPPAFGWHFLAHILLVQGALPQGLLPYAYVTLLRPRLEASPPNGNSTCSSALIAPRRLGIFALALLALGAAYHALSLPPWWQFSRAFLPDAAPYFALGIASARLLRGEGAKIFTLCLVGACAIEFSGGAEKALVPLAWALAIQAQRHSWGAMLEGRAVKYLGAISYPLYLVNEPVQRGLALALAPAAHGNGARFTALFLPFSVLVPLAAAAALHHGVELRFLRQHSLDATI